jgi:hypothetical protein
MQTTVGVIDLGSARTKLYVASVSEEGKVVPVLSTKSETGFFSKIGLDGEMGADDVESLVKTTREMAEAARSRDAMSIILIATEALRKIANKEMITDRIARELGLRMNILDPAVEADVFFAGAQMDSGTRFPVVDIGGGSVQLAWEIGKSISIPTGTFALEKRFQTPGKLPDMEAYAAMRKCISDEIGKVLKDHSIVSDTVIVGSTCMRDFFDFAMCVAGVVERPKEKYSAAEVDALFNAIAGKPYESLGDYYPNNPKFMYGADKALLNLQESLRATRSSFIIPTNESVSTSLVRLASNEEALERVGIKISDLS